MTPTQPHTAVIIQARMGSKRLPGKVLLDIAGEPMLAHVVRRARRALKVDTVLVATTSDPADDPIAGFCEQRGIAYYRGSQFDVLDRYYQAARQLQAQVIVRITADCPIIDPDLIDQTVAYFLGELGTPPPRPGQLFPWDFAANRLPPPWGRTFPIGLDTEVCSFLALETAWQHARQPHQREHVMPYLYEFSPVADSRRIEAYVPPDIDLTATSFDPAKPRFRVLLVNHNEDLGCLRWTVDMPEDLQVVRGIFQHFSGREYFSWQEVLELARKNPGLFSKNAAVPHKQLYDVDARRDTN